MRLGIAFFCLVLQYHFIFGLRLAEQARDNMVNNFYQVVELLFSRSVSSLGQNNNKEINLLSCDLSLSWFYILSCQTDTVKE